MGGQTLSLSAWAHPLLLIVLSFGTTRFFNWIVCLLIGSLLSVILNGLVAWPWIWNLQVGLIAVFVLPLLLKIFPNNIRISVAFLAILGIPSFLISRYYFDNELFFAITDCLSIAFLFPVAVLRMLESTGQLKKLKGHLDFKATIGRYPELAEIIKNDQKLLRTVKNDPALIRNFAKFPKLIAFIQINLSFAKMMTWRKELLEFIEKDDKLYALFRASPELFGIIGWHPKLLQAMIEYPSRIEMFQLHPDLIPLFKTDDVFIDAIKKHPEIVSLFMTEPGITSGLRKYFKEIKESLKKRSPRVISLTDLQMLQSLKSKYFDGRVHLSLEAQLNLQSLEKASQLSKELIAAIHPEANLQNFLTTYISLSVKLMDQEYIKASLYAFSSGSPERASSSSPISSR